MRSVLKILSILMIAGGLFSLILSVCWIAFSIKLTVTAGNGAWIILYSTAAIIANAVELITGILGVRVKSTQVIPLRVFLFGLLTVALNAAVILIADIPLETNISWITWVISLIVPILFTISAISGLKKHK